MSATANTASPVGVTGLQIGDHIVNDAVVNGYFWVYFQGDNVSLFPGGKLAFPGGQLHWQSGQPTLTSSLFDPDTVSGQLVHALSEEGVFELWSDQPNQCLRIQVSKSWGTVDRAEKQELIADVIDAFVKLLGDPDLANKVSVASARS